jgi:putative nucleotidyltransferase with HDIG domain
MASMGLDDARRLLASLDLPRGIVVHSEGVAAVAAEAALMVQQAGIPIDVRLVEVAALLHDIDKPETRHDPDQHGRAAARRLSEMGHPDLAVPIASHPLACLLDEERYPIGWPSVIVALADKHVAQCFVTIDERLDDMASRYPEYRGAIESARRPAHALEQELADVLGATVADVVERLRAAWQAAAAAHGWQQA